MDPYRKLLEEFGYGSEKKHSGSGQLRIRNEFEVKLPRKTDKIWQFLNKNAQFKNITKIKNTHSFLSKNFFLESLYLVIICNHQTRREYKGKIYVKNIRKKSCRIRNRIRIWNQLKSRIRVRKNHSWSTTLHMNIYRMNYTTVPLPFWGAMTKLSLTSLTSYSSLTFHRLCKYGSSRTSWRPVLTFEIRNVKYLGYLLPCTLYSVHRSILT